MDIKLENEESAVQGGNVEIVRRRELHFSCGCSTTQIESRRSREGDRPGCEGTGGVLLRKVEITEYRPRGNAE